uniref:Nesprin-1 n=1 Tax=Melanaphis sacchari TaxID=742174 RepID=A0A2H8TRL4_9HEMI
MITDVAETIGLNPDDVPLNEIEELSLKLEKVQKVLAALGDVADKKNKISDNIEDAKRLLHSIEKNSSKSIKNNDENLKELRIKLLDLNKSKKEMDESFDIDSFEIPLCEKRTYSIIEVFQLWQQIFKETFNQYRRLSCSLLENENNVAIFELWHDYLMYVQEFLKSPVPGDYHSLTSHERLCQVHQEVLISQMDTIPNCMNKPDIISEPVAMERFKSLMDLHNETMTELENTHQEVWIKLGHWKEYRTNVKKLYDWLWKVEKVHSNLNLKFINTKRLPQLKSQITSLLNKLAVERSQIKNLEECQNTIFSFCDKSTETGYRKELIAISQRANEIQASLEVWNGYLENIEKLTTSFEVQNTEIDKVLQDVQTRLDTLKNEFGSNEDIVPSDTLNTESKKIQELNKSLKQLDPQLLSITDIRDKLKDSLDPKEIRLFGQKLRFLIYHQKDLQYQLFLYSCQIDNMLYKPQEFTYRYTRFKNWTIDTENQLKNLTKSLKNPQFAIDVLKPEFESQINSKQKEFNWLNGAGNQLIKAESQLNPQLAKTTESCLKEINENWNNLNGSLYKYTVELPTTILNTNKLFDKLNAFKILISDLESKINNTIVFNNRSEYNLKEELKCLDALNNTYKEKQGEYNELIAACNEQLKSDENTNDSDTTQDLQCPSKTLPISWKSLENKISDKRIRVLSAWEELQTILGLIDADTKWLNRLNITVEEHKKKKFVEHKSLSGLISNFEQEQLNAKDKFSKLELAVSISRSTYTAKFIDEEIEIISKKRESLLEQINMILIVLKKSLTLWKDFINAHGRAVVTLTQVDTKLIQLELLDKSDNDDEGNIHVMEKNLGNLQILEMELKKYGGLLEKADALGLQLMTNSTPSDIKNIQEMIDEYQLLWKDINNRIEKLKVTCVQETSCRKKRSVNEEVQVETLKFGKDSQIQVDTLPTELLRKDSFHYELQTAIANAATNLNELELAIQKSDKNLSKNIATCQMSIDLIKHLSVILKTQCGVSESDITIIRSEELLTKYEELLVNFRSQQQDGPPKSNSSAMCPLCSEQNWSQFENDMWRLEHWIQSTEAKLSVQPMVPPSKIEQLEDVIQEHRELLLYLDSHRNIVQSLNVIGHHLAEHSNDEERAAQIKNRLSATNSRWDRVCFACTEWQTKLQTALMENDEFYGVIDELVDWLDETERAIKTTEPVDLAEDTVIIMDKFNKFKNMHAELERCEPRVVSLLEAADWLRQANEKTGAATRSASVVASASDQTIVDSHARLSHLRARLTVLINMTASYATKLGTTLGYDMSPDNVCVRLHQVDDTSTAMNRSNEEELNTNAGGDETVLRRGYRFFGRVMRASLPFQVLMLLVLGAASLVPIVDEEFSCMESNNIAWSLYPLLRYPGGPPPV